MERKVYCLLSNKQLTIENNTCKQPLADYCRNELNGTCLAKTAQEIHPDPPLITERDRQVLCLWLRSWISLHKNKCAIDIKDWGFSCQYELDGNCRAESVTETRSNPGQREVTQLSKPHPERSRDIFQVEQKVDRAAVRVSGYRHSKHKKRW